MNSTPEYISLIKKAAMIKIAVLIIAMLCFAVSARSQTSYSVRGSVADSAAAVKLVNTSIAVLRAKDSVLVKFTRADANGSFLVTGLSPGKFILLVTYRGYADFTEHFSLDSLHREHNFGPLNMFLKSQLLTEVVIKGNVPSVRIKGDTTEYNASNFVVQPNARVEDLLKQLPGVEVDRNGRITALGKQVEKVLVDGEEFFSDDPTLVTKNFRADMVDKVQVYDKKSEQATFTGIDDGEKTHTINLKLKEGKKNGYFGNLQASASTNQYHREQGMLNAFSGDRKLSVIGVIDRSGRSGLSLQPGSDGMLDSGDGLIYAGDDAGSFSAGGGGGIPVVKTADAHYEDKWGKHGQGIRADYRTGRNDASGWTNSFILNKLPDGIISTNTGQTSGSSFSGQMARVNFEAAPDSTSKLRVAAGGAVRNSGGWDKYTSNSRREDSTMLNNNTRSLSGEGTAKTISGSMLWMKKLKKKKRTFSIGAAVSSNEGNSDSFLNSATDYFGKDGEPDSSQNIDQLKKASSRRTVLRTNVNYTEPLGKDVALVFNYGFSYGTTTSGIRSLNLSPSGSYDQTDSLTTSDYAITQYSNQAGAFLNLKTGKESGLNFGSRISGLDFRQNDRFRKSVFKRYFVNWNPRADFNSQLSKQAYLNISYSGNTNQPGISQIQPVRENSDPLNVTLGNPDLKPSFSNQFSASYNSYRLLQEQSLGFSGDYNFTVQPIVANTVTDAGGKTTYQWLNFTGHNPSGFSLTAFTSRKLRKPDVNVQLNLNFNASADFNMTNNIVNKTTSRSYMINVNVSKFKLQKYNFMASLSPGYNTSRSSLQSQLNNNGTNLNGNFFCSVYLPGKFELGTDGNYSYQGKTESFGTAFERFVWNASLRKSFLKQDALKLSVEAYDLLKQNKGFGRSASGNLVTQTSYVNISRYFMFSLQWDFNKMGLKKEKKQ